MKLETMDWESIPTSQVLFTKVSLHFMNNVQKIILPLKERYQSKAENLYKITF